VTPEEKAAATHAPAPSALDTDVANAADIISPEDMKLLSERRKAYAQLANDPRVEPRDREAAKQRYSAVARIMASQQPKGIAPSIEGPGETFLRHAADAATFGGASYAARKLARAKIPGFDDPVSPTLPAPSEQMAIDDAASDKTNELSALGGELAGSMVPYGGPALAFKGAGALTKAGARLLPKLASPVARVGGGALRGALTVGIANPAIAGARAAFSDNERPAEAIKRELTNPLPYLLGAGVGAFEGAAGAIRESKGQTGRDIRTVEDIAKGRVSPIGGAKGGYFKSPVLEGMSTDEHVGEVARKAGQSIQGKLNDEFGAAGKEYGQTVDDARQNGALARRLDPGPLLEQAQHMVKSYRFSGATKGAIEREVITPLMDVMTSPNGNGTMSLEDFNAFKGKLGDFADVPTGGDSTFQSRAFGEMADTARTMRHATALGEADRAYATRMDRLEKAHESLGFRDTTHTDMGDPVAERKIANFIARHGEDTKTAGMQNEDARRLEELYPGRFTQELHAPEMLRAKQRLSLGFGGQGGLHHRVLPPLTHNIEPLMATGYLLGRRAPVLYPLIPTIGTLPGGDE